MSIKAILLKNYYYYKRNLSEWISLSTSLIIEVLPIFFMLNGINIKGEEISTSLVGFFIAILITNISVSTCYSYYKEKINEKDVEYKMAGLSKFSYSFVQVLFYFFLNIFSCAIICNIIFPGIINIRFGIIPIIICCLLIFSFICFIVMLDLALIYLIDKISQFSVATLVCNIIAILSGCYAQIDKFHPAIRIICLLNPFTYFVSLIKWLVFLTPEVPVIYSIFVCLITGIVFIFLSMFYK